MKKHKKRININLKKSFIPFVSNFFYFLLSFIFLTCLKEYRNFRNEKESLNQLNLDLIKDGPIIFACFHQRLLLIIFLLKKFNLTYMVSPSKDGDILARVINRLGGNTIRATNDKESVKGSLKLLKAIKSKKSICHLVDGPLGPPFILKEGLLKIAKISERPVVIFSISISKYWQVNSWDWLIIPKPFSKIICEVSTTKLLTNHKKEEMPNIKKEFEKGMLDHLKNIDLELKINPKM